jgi:cell division protein FtsI (penicillin-binding protein 3)/stage V sporulation protein D (sporulation-specific penicillin-binding protein)
VIRSTQQRALVACIGLTACFTAFSVRLVHLQVTKHAYYAKKAANQNGHRVPIFARRGTIVDVKGHPLAQNEPVKTVVADASLIRDPDALAAMLAEPLQMPVADIRAKLGRKAQPRRGRAPQPHKYIVLKKDVAESIAMSISHKVAASKGVVDSRDAVRFEQDFVRVYPNGSMLCHVLGYVDDDGRGVDGIEASLNPSLERHDGFRFIEHDRSGRELVAYRGQERAAVDGKNVRLTIDLGLQQIVEDELDAACARLRPKKATVVMMNPHTGEIMAMANRPNFNPNPPENDKKSAKPTAAKNSRATSHSLENRRNIAIVDQVEPGSTFKIVASSAALSERLVELDTEIFCENGYWKRCKLHDHGVYGSISVEKILVHSSNIGAAKLAAQLGEQRFYEYVRRFGFGERTSINLPDEIGGKVLPPYAWDKLTFSRMPMGQSIAVTPLQIANAMSVIANGGKLMVPQIVREIVDDNVKSDYQPREVHRVITAKAAAQVRDALIHVVGPKGTAPKAAVPGFKVAGKTGTAQKPDENGRMGHEDHVVSFVGFMPAEKPAFVMLVLFDEAQTKHGENYGGTVAGPVFASIATKVAAYLDLTPTEPITAKDGIIARNEAAGRVRD